MKNPIIQTDSGPAWVAIFALPDQPRRWPQHYRDEAQRRRDGAVQAEQRAALDAASCRGVKGVAARMPAIERVLVSGAAPTWSCGTSSAPGRYVAPLSSAPLSPKSLLGN